MVCRLAVHRGHLLEGFRALQPTRKPSKRALRENLRAKALLAFDGRFLSIEAFERTIVAGAEGDWPGLATISGNALLALVMAPPGGDPLIFEYAEGRLKVGTWAVSCEWQPISHKLLDLPAAPDWVETLALKFYATRAQILAGGYDPQIRLAERQLDKLVKRTVKGLSAFGVTEQDIRSLIETRLAQRYVSAT